jgi:hypothetical protein
MPIPEFDPSTGYLPAGEHLATWAEVEARFGTTPKRRQLMGGLSFVVRRLRERGVTTIWVDGSFVTAKERPRDVDVIYEAPAGADTSTWGNLSFNRKAELKQLQNVDLWPFPSPQVVSGSTCTILEFFVTDNGRKEKGIVRLVEDREETE